MKSILFVAIAILSVNCTAFAWRSPSSPEQMSLIKNYKTCSIDYDCREDQYCGFVAVDTYLVCKYGARDPWPATRP